MLENRGALCYNERIIKQKARGTAMKKRHVFGKKAGGNQFEPPPFDPETQTAVIRSSICTGEKVAGFKNKRDGHFTEVMLIRTARDVEEFKERYHVDTLRTEY